MIGSIQTTPTPTMPVHDAMRQQLHALAAEHPVATTPLLRVEVVVPRRDMLAWLIEQPIATKVYWSNREHSDILAGVGIAHAVDSENGSTREAIEVLQRLLVNAPSELRFVGGLRFDPHTPTAAEWQPYGAYRFILPRLELRRHEYRTTFACNLYVPPGEPTAPAIAETLALLDSLQFDTSGPTLPMPHMGERINIPDHDGWTHNVNTALNHFVDGDMQKIVLARKAVVPFDDQLIPLRLLSKLRTATPQAFHFCIQLDAHRGFIGASPERLYRRQGRGFHSEALAGTRRRGRTLAEDEQFRHELLTSRKERSEHQFVIDTVLQQVEAMCLATDTSGGTRVLQLEQVQHLHCHIIGVLKDGVTDADIIATLHPTPAVGGLPRDVALRTIAALEPFDRGWYAAPVGWIGVDSAEFSVGIRSGLINGNTLSLFSGAGIVPGSVPEQEWQEIENKLGNFRKALR
ncbi:MAG: isochorismate synthase [Anaerolineae bacterium]|nr:isochorismate synthase [Anaerolineae bacterium]